MNAFPGWRTAGHAMRWARRHPGIQCERGSMADWTEHAWVAVNGDRGVNVGWSSRRHRPGVSLKVETFHGPHVEATGLDAVEILGLLAVLGFVPADLAEVAR